MEIEAWLHVRSPDKLAAVTHAREVHGVSLYTTQVRWVLDDIILWWQI